MKRIFITLFVLLMATNAMAYRTNKPIKLRDPLNEEQISQINNFFEEIWLMQNGRFELDTGSEKSGAKNGELWINNSSTIKSLQFKSDDLVYTLPAIESGEAWEDIRVSGLAAKTGATAPDLVAFAPATTNLLVYGFDGSTNTEQAYFAIQFPHSYKFGTTIHPHVHWTPTDTNSGTVVWSMEYTWQEIGGTFAAPTTIKTTAVNAGGTAWVHKYSEFPDIAGTGKDTVSSMIIFRLFRNPADDTYEHDAALLEVDFHYTVDGFGSNEETSK